MTPSKKFSAILLLCGTVYTVGYSYQWVNGQVTDSITTTNVKVLGESPAQSMGMLYSSNTNSQIQPQHNCQQAHNPCPCLRYKALQQAVFSTSANAINQAMHRYNCYNPAVFKGGKPQS